MRSVDVLVIGAGVIGASVAYHLARRGCGEILVIDAADGPGEGSTGRATGGFRAQFASEVNVRLSLRSREKLLSFEEELGMDPGYARRGYLFLSGTAAGVSALREAQRVQHAAGLAEARMVEDAEIRGLNPGLAEAPLAGGAFCPSDGFIRPLAILQGYLGGAERLGVHFAWGEPCQRIRVRHGRVVEVRTPRQSIAPGLVVNAAGAWAGAVAALAGLSLPVTPLRRQVAVTKRCELLPEEMPMTIFLEDGFHLRVREGRILLLLPDTPRTRDPFDVAVEPLWVQQVLQLARERLPCLRAAVVDELACRAGLYEMSPDHHALLGKAPGLENLFLANGSSGHGVMHAPAIGELLAELMLDGQATIDATPLRPQRFAEGRPNPASVLL